MTEQEIQDMIVRLITKLGCTPEVIGVFCKSEGREISVTVVSGFEAEVFELGIRARKKDIVFLDDDLIPRTLDEDSGS